MSEIVLRPAARSDAVIIHQMILSERLNPISLDWRRFILAVCEDGTVAACIQVKPHADGTRELASLVVRPSYRCQGLAGRMIAAVLVQEKGPLYLTCRSSLESFYARFGFQALSDPSLPPYYLRLRCLFRWLTRIARLREDLAVMRRDGTGSI